MHGMVEISTFISVKKGEKKKEGFCVMHGIDQINT